MRLGLWTGHLSWPLNCEALIPKTKVIEGEPIRTPRSFMRGSGQICRLLCLFATSCLYASLLHGLNLCLLVMKQCHILAKRRKKDISVILPKHAESKYYLSSLLTRSVVRSNVAGSHFK